MGEGAVQGERGGEGAVQGERGVFPEQCVEVGFEVSKVMFWLG